MKAASLSEIKKELLHTEHAALVAICLRMARFKLINKELLAYLLFEAHDETGYIKKVKEVVQLRFDEMPFNSLFFTTKYIRKTLRITKQYIQYSGNKQTEVELLLFFCSQMLNSYKTWKKHNALNSLYERQLDKAEKELAKLHEDLQYEYSNQLQDLRLPA